MDKLTNNYVRLKGNNPFGAQAKMLLYTDRLNEYLTKGDTRPIEMEINLTNRCNLSCFWCINQNFRNQEELDDEALCKFMQSFRAMGGKSLVFSGGGEPTLYSYFEAVTVVARLEGIKLGLMTNGIYPKSFTDLIGNNFQWVRFSLDTLDSEKYKKWKGADGVRKVLDNICALSGYPVHVGVNCNISLEHTIKDIKSFLWLKNVVSYLQFRPVLPRYFLKESTKINKELWKYLAKHKHKIDFINLSNDKLSDLKTKTYFPFRSCEGHFFVPVLNANGDVCVCMYHPDDQRFVFGNIYKTDFKKVWKSARRKKVIEFVRGLDYHKHCQICCKLTETNRFLDYIRNPEEVRDHEFI